VPYRLMDCLSWSRSIRGPCQHSKPWAACPKEGHRVLGRGGAQGAVEGRGTGCWGGDRRAEAISRACAAALQHATPPRRSAALRPGPYGQSRRACRHPRTRRRLVESGLLLAPRL
jgi:hypothetical protein